MRFTEIYTAPQEMLVPFFPSRQEMREVSQRLRERFPGEYTTRDYTHFAARYNDEVEADWKAAWDGFND